MTCLLFATGIGFLSVQVARDAVCDLFCGHRWAAGIGAVMAVGLLACAVLMFLNGIGLEILGCG